MTAPILDYKAHIRKYSLPNEQECWVWQRMTNQGGYAVLKYQGKNRNAHRVAYMVFVGPIPEGLQVDHMCRRRDCVNPAHLRAVTARENTLSGDTPAARNARKVVCPRCRGPWSLLGNGDRYCRACAAERGRDGRPRVSALHCVKGHELFGANMWFKLRTDGRTQRVCRECGRIANREWQRKQRKAVS